MWRLFIFLLILIASVWFGLSVVKHPGYLLLSYQPWMVQMPLWFALLSTLIVFGLLYFLFSSLGRIQFWWFRVKNWFKFRKEHRLYSKTQHGLILLLEAHWKKAERLLLGGVQQSADPLTNYLGAAKAAHELKEYERRDDYIKKAYHLAPDAEFAIGLVQAEFELQQDKLAQAAATLQHLYKLSPKHERVLTLLEKVYVRLGDWDHLQDLLPKLRKANIINSHEYEIFLKNIYCEKFNSQPFMSLDQLHDRWSQVPKQQKKNAEVVYAYIKQLQHFNDHKEIEALIKQVLKQEFSPALVKIYADLPINNVNRQLVMVGAWLKMYGDQPEILNLLAKLCVHAQLWGKAKAYYQRSLEVKPQAQVVYDYGRLLEQLGEHDQALDMYRNGLINLRVEN